MKLSAEKEDEEGESEPMDLDLEQMFEVGVCFVCELLVKHSRVGHTWYYCSLG